MRGKKLGEICLSGLREYGQVATVHHVHAELARTAHHVAEMLG
jgi:hypothetical protein